jgi:hypothetical protein
LKEKKAKARRPEGVEGRMKKPKPPGVLVESLEAICAPSTATMKGLLNKNGFLGAQQTPRPDAQHTPRPDAQHTLCPDAQHTPRPKTGRIMSRQEQVRRGCVFTCLVCSCKCLCSSHFCFVNFVLFSAPAGPPALHQG